MFFEDNIKEFEERKPLNIFSSKPYITIITGIVQINVERDVVVSMFVRI